MTVPAVVRVTVPGAPAVVRVVTPGPPGPSTGEGGDGTTNLSVTGRSATGLTIASSTGTDALVPAATNTEAGLATAAQVTLIEGAVQGNDARLTDSREWSAATVGQAEAEAGTATTRRAWTAERVFQAIAAWWAGSAAAAKLAGIATGATANSTDAQLRDRSTHTGTQAAGTITGLATVATTGAYSDLSGRPTLGGAASLNVGTTAGTVAAGDDARLSDARTPTAHTQAASTITGLATVATSGAYSDLSGTPTLGKMLQRWVPRDSQPPASNFATLDTRNSIAVLNFNDTTQQSAVFVGIIPDAAVLTSGLLVRIMWMAASATSGNVRWGASFERIGTDNDADSFDSVTEVTSAANGTSGIETVASITCTAIDSLAAGDRFRLRIARIAADAVNDTVSLNAQLVAVELRQVA